MVCSKRILTIFLGLILTSSLSIAENKVTKIVFSGNVTPSSCAISANRSIINMDISTELTSRPYVTDGSIFYETREDFNIIVKDCKSQQQPKLRYTSSAYQGWALVNQLTDNNVAKGLGIIIQYINGDDFPPIKKIKLQQQNNDNQKDIIIPLNAHYIKIGSDPVISGEFKAIALFKVEYQ